MSEPSTTTPRISREIRAARTLAGMSRLAVGRYVGVSAGTIGRWERGDFTRQLTNAYIEAIAAATQLPQAYRDAGFLSADPAKRIDTSGTETPTVGDRALVEKARELAGQSTDGATKPAGSPAARRTP